VGGGGEGVRREGEGGRRKRVGGRRTREETVRCPRVSFIKSISRDVAQDEFQVLLAIAMVSIKATIVTAGSYSVFARSSNVLESRKIIARRS